MLHADKATTFSCSICKQTVERGDALHVGYVAAVLSPLLSLHAFEMKSLPWE